MGLYKNGNLWWAHVGMDQGKRIRRSTGIPVAAPTKALEKQNRKDAEIKAWEFLRELRLGKKTGFKPAPTFRAWATHWEAVYAKTQRGYDARVTYRVKALIAAFGDLPLDEIHPDVVSAWRNAQLAAQKSASSINRTVDDLKSILTTGVGRFYAVSPIKGLAALPAPQTKIVTLSPEDEKKIVGALRPEDNAIFLVALDGLARLGDVLDMRWEDVSGRTILVRQSKNGKPYRVILSDRAQAALDALPKHGPWCFPDRRRAGSEKARANALRVYFQRLCERLGVPYGRKRGGVTWHSATRHTGASRLVNQNINLRTVQAIGGWSDVRMLSIYAHPDEAVLVSAVNQVGTASSSSTAPTSAGPEA